MTRRSLLLSLASAAMLACQTTGPGLVTPQAPFVATPDPVAIEMLRLAGTTDRDVVYDLGCGDGRVVITAAKKYGTYGFGFEIDPTRVRESLENVQRHKVERLVTWTRDAMNAWSAPSLSEPRDLFERPRLGKQVRGPRHDDQPMGTDKPRGGLLVQLQHQLVLPADD